LLQCKTYPIRMGYTPRHCRARQRLTVREVYWIGENY
jgi:hypothetical protein